ELWREKGDAPEIQTAKIDSSLLLAETRQGPNAYLKTLDFFLQFIVAISNSKLWHCFTLSKMRTK
ncbi:MAG: hypothetical protein ACR2OY_13250, partial [Boseongicola sp.]